jgi:hypothetical protein
MVSRDPHRGFGVSGGTVWFFLPHRAALGGRDPAELDPDRDWNVFGTGQYIWILQTFLRLRDAGASVELVATAPRDGLVVCFADDVHRLRASAPPQRGLTVVSVRADRQPQELVDFEVVQNASSAGRHRIFIPLWLQPGLVRRGSERGTRVETVAFMGNRQELHGELLDPAWPEALGTRNLRWDNRMVTFVSNDRVYDDLRWNDYSEVDVLVALRPPERWRGRSKPASKLQNAWAAGVPAILSPELPYQELRRSPLDFLEAATAAEALQAVERLRADGELYTAMVENGLERARAFRADELTRRWTVMLWHDLPTLSASPRHRLTRRIRYVRSVAGRLERRLRALGS